MFELLIQLLGVCFGLVMLYFSFLYYKKGNYKRCSFIIWAMIWLAYLVVIIIPSTISSFIQPLGLTLYGFILVLIIIVFGSLIFYLYNVQSANKQKLEFVVRETAIAKPIKKSFKKIITQSKRVKK